jgi:spore germination protein GerM
VPQPLGVKDRLLLLGLTLTAEETTQGFRSAVAPASVTGVVTAGGVATVDLTAMFAEMPANEQVLALAQITYTLTDMPGIGQVVFTLNGAPVQVFGGDGMFVAGPVTRETYAQRFATPPSETVRR